MCKLAGLSTTHRFSAGELAAFAAIFHAHSRDSSPDGFGWAHHTRGGLRLARWHKTHCFVPGLDTSWAATLSPAPLAIHARAATCRVLPENTHPLSWAGHALVHNGAVLRPGHWMQNTSCDSEFILQAFLEGGHDEICHSVLGRFAYLLIDSHGRLHVARDDQTSLYFAHIRERECYVFGTDLDFLEALPFAVGSIRLFPKMTYGVFDGPLELRRTAFNRAEIVGGPSPRAQ